MFRYITPIRQNQKDMSMEHFMDSGVLLSSRNLTSVVADSKPHNSKTLRCY